MCIKLQEENIANLIKKLEKQSAQSSIKDSKSEEEDKESFIVKLLPVRSSQRKVVSLKNMGL